MSSLFTMPELPKDRLEISLYRTLDPAIDGEFIKKYAQVFQVMGKAKNTGSRNIVEDQSGVLEIFEASGSIWWTSKTRIKSEPRKSVQFPPEEEAISRANTYLAAMGLTDKQANTVSVTYTETFYLRDEQKEPQKAITNQHINYVFRLDGLPVWGPGAKIQVTYGSDDQVTEVLKFWREPKKEQNKHKLIPVEKAVKIFQTDDAFSDLSIKTANVKVDEISLGYYALPPREVQACLIPVYRFKGFVSTERLERYDFAMHVIAVDLTADLLKKTGIAVTGSHL